MGNPFEDLARAGQGESEEVGGMFSCQEEGCFDIEEEATYYPSLSRLEWTCEEGHQNRVEDFNIA